MRGLTRNSGKPFLGLVLQHKGVKASNRFPCLLDEGVRIGSLNGVNVEVHRWVGPGGRLRWSAYPLGGAVCRDHALDPAFALSTSEMVVGGLFVTYFS